MKKIFSSLVIFFSSASIVFAEITNPVIPKALGTDADKAKSGEIFSSYFVTVWRALITIGVLAVLFNLVNGALEWITAGGEQSKVEHARQKMTNAVVGMVILSGTFVLIGVIGTLFNFDLLKFTLPSF
jgi:hypothetical protein